MIILVFGVTTFLIVFALIFFGFIESPLGDGFYDTLMGTLIASVLGAIVGALSWVIVASSFPQNEDWGEIEEVDIIEVVEDGESNSLVFTYKNEHGITKQLETSEDRHTIVEASEGEEKIIKIYHYYNNKHIDYLFGGTPSNVYEIHMNKEGSGR